jgi:hypothetical protein
VDSTLELVERTFLDCLNWENDDILKKQCESEFENYIFKIRNKNSFLLHAKKTGQYFNIPISFNLSRRLQIGNALSKDEKIKFLKN